jgi:hypothetical protein
MKSSYTPEVPESSGSNARLDRLKTIERLLAQYRKTKDRETLRLALELWDQTEAARAQTASTRLQHTH